MSSSCVPPKGCVMHDPDPYRADDHDDGASECGSLCTCTSGSMTSLATSIGSREAGALGRNGGSTIYIAAAPQQAAAAGANQSGTQAAAQATDGSGSPYFVVFVSPQLSGRESSGCGNCRLQRETVQAALKASLRTACDFCPWIAGFVIIYYSFYWWGVGPGFSAFLCAVGAHALFRFVKARGVLRWSTNNLSQVQQESSQCEEEGDEEESESREQQARREAIEKLANEKPPSYEAAVVKPPPYDLQFHLTPTQPRSQTIPCEPQREYVGKMLLTVPQLVVGGTAEDRDDVFLPSYQDAIRLSFRSDKDPRENEEQE